VLARPHPKVGTWENHCPDNRSQAWRLWTYQFLPAGWGHLAHGLLWQLLLGAPVNMVHGDAAFLALHQGLAVPLAALAVGYADPLKVVSRTVVSGAGALSALVGVCLSNLAVNWGEAGNGLLPRWTRLGVLALCCATEVSNHTHKHTL
jgi:membrane associated rhomboid family serine protease